MNNPYFKSHAINQTKTRVLCGVSVSSLAVGTYLGASDAQTDKAYEESLVYAAQNGINFFDTAINYRCQRSEKNIAYAIKKLATLGIAREQMFISTKGGFLSAKDEPSSFQAYVLKDYLNTGIITADDIVQNCHCMTPQYMQSQIDLSLANLKLDTIDLYYLHNPEIQLPVVGEKEFYRRLKTVFEVFEKNVAAGKIKNYGMATWNGFRVAHGSPERLDLAQIIACAKDVAGDAHHFAAIQLPYNLAMLEAVGIKNQKVDGEDFPIIAAAAMQNIAVLVSAPLLQSNVLRIPQALFNAMPGELTPAQKALQFVTSSPGVIAAMVGMSQVAHVEENLKVLQQGNWEVADLQNISSQLVRK